MDNVADLADGVEDTLERLRRVDDGVLAGASNPISKWYIERSPVGNMVNQELEMSCVPAACREMLRDLFAEAGLSIDVEEALLREGMGTSEFGTRLTHSDVIETLNNMVIGTDLEDHIRFMGGRLDIVDSNPMTIENFQQAFVSKYNTVVTSVGEGKGLHAVIVDTIDLDNEMVFVRDPWGMSDPGSDTGILGRLTWDRFYQLWRSSGYEILIGDL